MKPKPSEVKKLIEDNKRLIEAEAFKYSSNVPITVAQIEAYKLANQAANNFDPSMGVKFSTYLTSYLQKLYRLGTQYGAIVRVSENKQFSINKINNIQKELEANLGRPPSVAELADASGFNMPTIRNLLENRKQTVNLENLMSSPVFFDNANDDWVHFVYHDLAPRDKVILEHKLGYANKKVIDNEELAEKLNISQSTLSNRIKFISNKLKEGWK